MVESDPNQKFAGKPWPILDGVNIGVECYAGLRSDGMTNGDPSDPDIPQCPSAFEDDLDPQYAAPDATYNHEQILAVVIPKSAWRGGAVEFGQWAKKASSAYWRQLFSMFFRIVRLIVEKHEAAQEQQKKESEQDDITPRSVSMDALHVFIECVFDDSVSEEDASDSDFYHTSPEVVAYRFIALPCFDADIGGLFWNIIEDNMKVHEECQDKSGKKRNDCVLTKHIQEHEHYKYVNCVQYWSRALAGLYMNSDILARERLVDFNVSRGEIYGVCKKKRDHFHAHPLNVFSLENMFARNFGENDSQSRIENYVTKTANGGQLFKFPLPAAVLKLEKDLMRNYAFFSGEQVKNELDDSTPRGRWFPDYQRFKQRDISQLVDGDNTMFIKRAPTERAYVEKHETFDDREEKRNRAKKFDTTMFLSHGKDHSAPDRELERIMQNDMGDLAKRASGEKIRSMLPSDVGFRETYLKSQQALLKEFRTSCWSGDAAISAPAKAILKFYEKGQCIAPGGVHGHENLSIFGDMIVKRIYDYENLLYVSTAHKYMMLLLVGRYDAYRVDMGLHYNHIFTGEGSTGKSFLLETMALCSINGTTKLLTYETSKAAAIDGPQNDEITIFNEAPPGTLTGTKNQSTRDAASLAMLKERLTSCKVTVKTFFQLENSHIRRNRTATSECMGSFFGATNDDISDVEEALRTRFAWGSFCQNARPGKSIEECVAAFKSNIRTPSGRRDYDTFLSTMKQEQMIVFLAEKFISCRILMDVETSIASLCFQRFSSGMAAHGVSCPPRDIKRVSIIARKLAIVSAIHSVFKIKGGACYGKAVFELADVLHLEPHLFCTPEIAYFSIGLMSDQFIDPAKEKVLNALRSILKVEFGAQHGSVYKYNPEMYKLKQGRGDEEASPDYNYVKFPWNLSTLITKIQAGIPRESGRPSAHNINRVLKDLKKYLVKHSRYTDCDKETGLPCFSNEQDIIRTTAALTNRTSVFIHSGILIGAQQVSDSDIVKQVLANLSNPCTRSQSYICGWNVVRNGETFYDMFDVLERQRTAKTSFDVKNPNYQSRRKMEMQGKIVAEDDERLLTHLSYSGYFDDIALTKHHTKIGLSPTGKDMPFSKTFSTDFLKRRLCANVLSKTDSLSYPEFYFKKHKTPKRTLVIAGFPEKKHVKIPKYE